MKFKGILKPTFLFCASFFFLMANSSFAASNSAEGGIKAEIIQSNIATPPIGFDPLKASSDELVRYGFPKRPTDEKALEQWNNAMAHAKKYVEPIQIASKAVHGPINQDDHASYSHIWAGYVVQSANNKVSGNSPSYYHAQASWDQPSFSGSNGNPSFWVGMGGFTSGNLVQAGADSHATWSGGTSHYEFWVEDFPLGTVWEASPTISGGDTVYVDVTYNGSTSSAFLENITTGNYTTVSFSSPYYSGDSADFVHEAMGGVYTSWGSTDMDSCYLGYKIGSTSYSGGLSSYSSTEVIMTNNGTPTGTTEAYPSASISGNDFTLYSS